MNDELASQAEDSRTHLRLQVGELVERLRRSEALSRRIHGIELQLLAAEGLAATIDAAVSGLAKEFDLPRARLVLEDLGYDISRALRALPDQRLPDGLQLCHQPGQIRDLLSGSDIEWLPAEQLPGGLRSAATEDCEGVLLVPLARGERLIGMLLLINAGALHQNPDAAEYLRRFGAILAVALENAIALERLKIAGLTDALTGVKNRRYFEQRLGEEWQRARRYRRPLAAAMVDIDRFKRINDAYGHQAGDEVLQAVARAMGLHMRQSDVLCRYGGEEFAVLLPDTPPVRAQEVAERLRAAVAGRPFAVADEVELHVTISVGIAAWQPAADQSGEFASAEALIAAADRALYAAKEAGRNVTCAAWLLSDEASG